MDNKGPINEASVKSKTKKGKAKAVSKGGTLHTKTSLWRKMKDVEKMVTSISNRQIKIFATIEDMENFWNLFYA
ncbi:hypothetical protein J1N35_043517 [Gossypium stocksii]|uniref:Uncharacterized protein n=1 Tax=Gossypium stocksii TaxID=47602 RepID=A0A9D3ZFK6_9ROSI|nr:hypothetical protein J1N35_043517 [Gossypium stocksii]